MYRGGIGGIERKIKDKQESTDKHINEAFQDLTKLIQMAKEMTSLSQNIVQKLRDKGNDISSDETVLFKSHLLSLGVSDELIDPVTRKNFVSDNKYYHQLGKEVAQIIKPLIEGKHGQMSLTDAYCTVNRARGLELISAEDLLNACTTLSSQKLGLKLVKYPSGLMALQCDTYDESAMANETLKLIEQMESATPHELALQVGITVALARQRLLDCEKADLACRDESIEGLRFYPNKFLSS